MEQFVKRLSLKRMRTNKKNKGSVLVVTLLVVNLLLILALFLTSKMESLIFYNSNLSAFTLKEDLLFKGKEYVMSRFNTYFGSNLIGKSEKEIHEFFKGLGNVAIVSYENSKIIYDAITQKFNIETKVQGSTVIIDKFIIQINNEEICYKFLNY